MASQNPTCARCFQPLAAGANFCVACGYTNNQDAVAMKHVAGETEMQRRRERNAGWVRWLRWSWIGWWLPRP